MNPSRNLPNHSYFVYILGSGKGTLYVGVTNDLERRIHEHKAKIISGFTSRYNVDKLLYWDEFADISEAIEAEKRIKGWTRKKKLALIRGLNPTFQDLAQDW